MQPYYGLRSHVIDDYSLGRRYAISDNIYLLFGVTFDHYLNISIKEFDFYTFKKEEPFKKISNEIFSLVHSVKTHGIKYYLKVTKMHICDGKRDFYS